jgi:MFS transporter, PAT family, beta-lactamase induction signal transducer AmpG
LFTNLPSESFAKAMERSGVNPQALATGYTVFFLYSTLIGVLGIILSFIVVRKNRTA